MKMTKKTYYAFCTICSLVHESKTSLDLAKEMDTSREFIQHIASKLRNAHIIDIRNGCKGGYSLSRPLNEIYVNDIFEAMGEDIMFVDENDSNIYARKFFTDAGLKIRETFNVTFDNICKK